MWSVSCPEKVKGGSRGCLACGDTVQMLEYLPLKCEEYQGYREELAHNLEDILSQGKWCKQVQEDRILTTLLFLEDHSKHLWEPFSKVIKNFLA